MHVYTVAERQDCRRSGSDESICEWDYIIAVMVITIIIIIIYTHDLIYNIHCEIMHWKLINGVGFDIV